MQMRCENKNAPSNAPFVSGVVDGEFKEGMYFVNTF